MSETDGANTSGRRALVVEQDREDAGLLGFHLKRQGLPTMVVSTLTEAWDAMSWGTPDIVVVELGNPEVDALEFAVSLSGKTAAVFVVASRTPTADEELTLLRLGVREIFLKPLDHRSVAQKLSSADVRQLPQDSEIQASSIRGALADHPVDALLDLARRHQLNARLMIQSPGQGEGSLIIREGSVIDGIRGDSSGRAAVLATAATTDGRFDLSLLDVEDPALGGEDLVKMDLASLMSTAFEARVAHPKTRRPRARQRPTTIPPGMARRLIQERAEDEETENSEPSTRFSASPWTAVHDNAGTGPSTVHSGTPQDMPEVKAPPVQGPKPRPRAGHGPRSQPDSSIVRTEFEDREADSRFEVDDEAPDLGLDESDLRFLEGDGGASQNQIPTDTDAKTQHQQAPSSMIVMPQDDGSSDYLVFESEEASPARTMVQQTQARARDSGTTELGGAPAPSVLEDMGDTDQLMPSLSDLDVESRPLGTTRQPTGFSEERTNLEDTDQDLLPTTDGFEDVLPPAGSDDDDERPPRPDPSERRRRDSNTLLPSLDDLELPSTRRDGDPSAQTTPNEAVDPDEGPPTREEPPAGEGPPTREEEEPEEPTTGPVSSDPVSRPMSRPLSRPISRAMDLDEDLGAEFRSDGGRIFRRLLLLVLAIAFVFLGVKFGQRLIASNPSTSPGAGLVGSETAEDEKKEESPAKTDSEKVAEISGMKDGAPERTYALGVQAMKKKDFDDATKRFRLVLSEVPDHAGAMAGLFQSLMHQAKYDDATTQLDKLFEASPEDPKLHFYKALLSQKMGDSVQARTSLNRFLELSPEHAWAPKAKKILSTLGEDQP